MYNYEKVNQFEIFKYHARRNFRSQKYTCHWYFFYSLDIKYDGINITPIVSIIRVLYLAIIHKLKLKGICTLLHYISIKIYECLLQSSLDRPIICHRNILFIETWYKGLIMAIDPIPPKNLSAFNTYQICILFL